MHHAEDGRARADAKRQRQNGGRRDDGGPAQAAPAWRRSCLSMLRCSDGAVRTRSTQQAAPEAPPAFLSPAVAVQPRHLATEFVAKIPRVQVQQTSVPPLAGRVASHDVLRLGVRPAARAWRRSVVSRSASACATSRPNRVSR